MDGRRPPLRVAQDEEPAQRPGCPLGGILGWVRRCGFSALFPLWNSGLISQIDFFLYIFNELLDGVKTAVAESQSC